MDQMSKLEIIKEYIIKDRNRFSLAKDIHDNFGETREYLKDLLYSLLEKEILAEFPNVKTNPYRWYANDQYLDVIYSDDLKIQINFKNYFQNPVLNVSRLNSENATIITSKFEGSYFQGDRVVINLDSYNFNKISEVLELYDLYKDEDLQKEFLSNFKEHVLPTTLKVFDNFKEL